MVLLTAYLLLFILKDIAFAQRGEFPVITNLAPFKPVTSTSVCGSDQAESYCHFTSDAAASLAPNCISRVCNNTCPFGNSSPLPLDLISRGTFGTGVTIAPPGPGSQNSSVFINGSRISIPSERIVLQLEPEFSFAAWINPQMISERCSGHTIVTGILCTCANTYTIDTCINWCGIIIKLMKKKIVITRG